jgi:hypothetical protein
MEGQPESGAFVCNGRMRQLLRRGRWRSHSHPPALRSIRRGWGRASPYKNKQDIGIKFLDCIEGPNLKEGSTRGGAAGDKGGGRNRELGGWTSRSGRDPAAAR